MAMTVIAGTAAGPIVDALFKIINNYMEKRKNSEDEKEELKKSLRKLVELTNNSAIAFSQYTNLLKRSTEASVHCTELESILKNNDSPAMGTQFDKLIHTRMEPNLYKEAIQGIYNYREDYEKVCALFFTTHNHALRASDLSMKDTKAACIELEYANRALDDIVILAKRRIQELTEGMQEAYKMLKF